MNLISIASAVINPEQVVYAKVITSYYGGKRHYKLEIVFKTGGEIHLGNYDSEEEAIKELSKLC